MSIIPSLILYNPLESFLLLFACYLLRDTKYKDIKFNFKNYVIHAYKLGTICLIIQAPMNLISNPVLFMIYNIVIVNFVVSITLFIYANKYVIRSSLLKCFLINVLYSLSIIILLNICDFEFIASLNNFNMELFINIFLKVIQFSVLIGVYLMKKLLINIAKKSMKDNIAATNYSYGEPKLPDSLKQEIMK